MTTSPDSTPEPRKTSRLVVVVALVVAGTMGLLLCAGALSAPFIMLMYRRQAVNVEAQRAFEQNRAMKGEAEEAARQKATETPASEAVEPDRTQPQ